MNVIKVKSGDSFAIINATDYDENTHELYEGETLGGTSDVQKLADEIETRRQIEANRGVINSSNEYADRNTSGTFSTPTPTDVRYPNKNETEFENNHGAFIGKSAPDLRSENDLPDEPGGVNPVAEEKRRKAGKGADSAPPARVSAIQPTEHNPDVGGSASDGESKQPETVTAQTTDDGAGPVEIPSDWEGSHWRTRAALAEKISGRPNVKPEDANAIIQAEVARRG